MRKQFEDTAVGSALSAAIDVIFAGLLWCLCSIPVITVGPASAARADLQRLALAKLKARLAREGT